MAGWNYTHFQDYIIPQDISTAATVVGSILVSVGIIGNFLIIASLAINKKLRKKTNVFIGSLAIADLIFLIGLCSLYIHVYCKRRWNFNGSVCFYAYVMTTACVTSTLFHVVVITFYRFMFIVYPQHNNKITKNWVISIVMILVYICSFGLVSVSQPDLFTVPEIKMGVHLYFHLKTFFCPAVNKAEAALPVAIIISFIAVILLLMYLAIYIKVRRSRKNMELHTSSPLSPTVSRQKARTRRDIRVVKIMLVVFVVFILTYIPWPVVYEVQRNQYVPDWLHLVVNILLWCTSCVNWVIYGLMNKDFRDTYKSVLFCRCKQCTTLAYSDSTGSNQIRETPT